MNNKIHIGEVIKSISERSGMSVTAFADKIGVSRNNIYDIYKRSSIDTGLLGRISKALNHNFFEYYMVPEDRIPMPNPVPNKFSIMSNEL